MNNLTEWDAEFALLTPAERSYVKVILRGMIMTGRAFDIHENRGKELIQKFIFVKPAVISEIYGRN